jgi:hypothetical protein
MAGRAGLVAKKVTDRRGHTGTHWVNPNKNGHAAHYAKADAQHPASGRSAALREMAGRRTGGRVGALLMAGGGIPGVALGFVAGRVLGGTRAGQTARGAIQAGGRSARQSAREGGGVMAHLHGAIAKRLTR